MHGGTFRWLAGMLAATLIGGGVTAALGQDGLTYSSTSPSYVTQPANMMVAAPVANTSFMAGKKQGLDARVAALEEALQKAQKAEAKAKKSAAGKPTVKAGGRVQVDWALFDQDAASLATYGDNNDGCEFRRARIYVKGDAFHVIDYKIQMDFAAAPRAAFKDVYITVKELPLLGHARIGHFKEPFSLEELTSSRFITFMERGLPVAAFAPSRNMGVMAFDHSNNERMTWAIGAFRSKTPETPPIVQNDNGGTAVTMRGTFLPWYDEGSNGRGLFHVGMGYSYRNIDDGFVRFRSRPEAHLSQFRVVDTNPITDVSDYHLLDIEAAFVYGPFSVQAEWLGSFVPRNGALAQENFNGYYIYASYFLTGENRAYDRRNGYFKRVKPHENFFRVRTCDGCVSTGKGAWEIAYRHSYLDLVGTNVNGGYASDHTIGLNWYLNPYTRLMLNYVNSTSTPEAGVIADSTMGIYEMRAMIDF